MSDQSQTNYLLIDSSSVKLDDETNEKEHYESERRAYDTRSDENNNTDLTHENPAVSLNGTTTMAMDLNNKYANLGLSLNSQELIADFYQSLLMAATENENNIDSHEVNARRAKSFEEIIFSLVEDIQSYIRETDRLEQSLRMEKEKNEQVLKHMIEEADHQLATSIDLINQKQNREREQFEKTMEKLRDNFNLDIADLQETLDRMKQNEEKWNQERTSESMKINELSEEIRILNEENELTKSMLKTSEANVMNLQARIRLLQQDILNEDAIKSDTFNESTKENQILRKEIQMLNEENTLLIDKNDALNEELETLKLKFIHNFNSTNLPNLNNNCNEDIHQHNQATSLKHELESCKQLQQQQPQQDLFELKQHQQLMYQHIDSDGDLDSGYHNGAQDSPPLNVNIKKRDSSVVTDDDTDEAADDDDEGVNANNCDSNGNNENKFEREMSEPRKSVAKKEKRTKIMNSPLKMATSTSTTSTTTSIAKCHATKPTGTTISDLNAKSPESTVFKIVVAGDSTIDKSCLTKRYGGETGLRLTPSAEFQVQTIDIDENNSCNRSVVMQLWDTCSQERYHSIVSSYFQEAHGAILVYDCSNERSFMHVREWLRIMRDHLTQSIPIALVALTNNSNRRALSSTQGTQLASEHSIMYVEASENDMSIMDASFADLCKSIVNNCHGEGEIVKSQLTSYLTTQQIVQEEQEELSSQIEVLKKQNNELRSLIDDGQCLNDELRRQLKDILASNQQIQFELNDAKLKRKSKENINKIAILPSLQRSPSYETKSLQNAYKKLNDINDLLRDEIENIKMKASKMAGKEHMPDGNANRSVQASSFLKEKTNN